MKAPLVDGLPLKPPLPRSLYLETTSRCNSLCETCIILGNLHRQSLEEIWWGERYLDFRTAIQTDVPPEPCRGCGVKWSL